MIYASSNQALMCYNTPAMRNLTPIDISNFPDLVRIAEEVKATRTPRILKRDSEPVAMLMPVGSAIKHPNKGKKTKADYEAFRSAAGGWKDVDTDKLIKDIYASRKISTRPPVEL
jgi:hypothetical protein